jgi:hypothetical protein
VKKVLVALGLVALAAAGGVFAWQLVGDDDERRLGVISSIQNVTSLQTPTAPQPGTITLPPPYSVQSASMTVSPNSNGDETAGCPTGLSVLAGGHNISPNMSGSSVFGSYPSGATWRARRNNPHGSANMSLTAYVTCGDLGGVEVRTASTTVSPESIGDLSAACPSGKSPVGGGLNMSPNMGSSTLYASYPNGANWRVRVNNPHGSVSMNLTVYAVCASVPEYEIRTGGAGVRFDVIGEAWVSCPGGKDLLGGGHFMSPSVPESWVFGSYPSGQRWRVRMNNPHASSWMDVTAYAVCGAIG